MTSFADLQAEHQTLLDRLPSGPPTQDYLGAVQAFIARATTGAADIAAARDRNQLRANLRFWASYVFDHTGAYPDTTLHPSTLSDPSEDTPLPVGEGPGVRGSRRPRWLAPLSLAAAGLALCLAIPVCVLTYNYLNPGVGTGATSTPPTIITTAPETPDAPTSTSRPGDTTSTPDPSRTPPPSSTAALTSPPPSTQPAPRRTLMLAEVSQQTSPDCARRIVQVSLDPGELVPPGELRGALAELRFPGSHQPDAVAEVGPNGATFGVEVFDGDETPLALLLTLNHPSLTFSSVVLQFEPGCANNQALVRYVAAEAPSALPAQPPAADGLDLAWTLITWGPAPDDLGAWIAEIELFAEGGDGNFIFWDGASYSTSAPRILLSEQACDSAHRAVGVSSAGASLIKEVILQAPYCPKST